MPGPSISAWAVALIAIAAITQVCDWLEGVIEVARARTSKSIVVSILKLTATVFTLSLLSPTAGATCTDIPQSTPDSSLRDNGDSTITHHASGLMWKQCAEGQTTDAACTGTAARYNWQEALQLVETINSSGGFAGFTDWRLPNINELRSIVEESCYGPAININRFPNTHNGGYWSSSINANDGRYAWFVLGNNGFSASGWRNVADHHVRLVRDTQ